MTGTSTNTTDQGCSPIVVRESAPSSQQTPESVHCLDPSKATQASSTSLYPSKATQASSTSLDPSKATQANSTSLDPSKATQASSTSLDPSKATQASSTSLYPSKATQANSTSLDPSKATQASSTGNDTTISVSVNDNLTAKRKRSQSIGNNDNDQITKKRKVDENDNALNTCRYNSFQSVKGDPRSQASKETRAHGYIDNKDEQAQCLLTDAKPLKREHSVSNDISHKSRKKNDTSAKSRDCDKKSEKSGMCDKYGAEKDSMEKWEANSSRFPDKKYSRRVRKVKPHTTVTLKEESKTNPCQAKSWKGKLVPLDVDPYMYTNKESATSATSGAASVSSGAASATSDVGKIPLVTVQASKHAVPDSSNLKLDTAVTVYPKDNSCKYKSSTSSHERSVSKKCKPTELGKSHIRSSLSQNASLKTNVAVSKDTSNTTKLDKYRNNLGSPKSPLPKNVSLKSNVAVSKETSNTTKVDKYRNNLGSPKSPLKKKDKVRKIGSLNSPLKKEDKNINLGSQSPLKREKCMNLGSVKAKKDKNQENNVSSTSLYSLEIKASDANKSMKSVHPNVTNQSQKSLFNKASKKASYESKPSVRQDINIANSNKLLKPKTTTSSNMSPQSKSSTSTKHQYISKATNNCPNCKSPCRPLGGNRNVSKQSHVADTTGKPGISTCSSTQDSAVGKVTALRRPSTESRCSSASRKSEKNQCCPHFREQSSISASSKRRHKSESRNEDKSSECHKDESSRTSNYQQRKDGRRMSSDNRGAGSKSKSCSSPQANQTSPRSKDNSTSTLRGHSSKKASLVRPTKDAKSITSSITPTYKIPRNSNTAATTTDLQSSKVAMMPYRRSIKPLPVLENLSMSESLGNLIRLKNDGVESMSMLNEKSVLDVILAVTRPLLDMNTALVAALQQQRKQNDSAQVRTIEYY